MVGAALALSLGLSIRYVHARVEHLVDNVFFRKRHEDERALSDFSREAAYFTAADVLLDELMRRIELHTDARSGRLFLNHESMFVTVRALGESHGAVEIDENDSAIVALKTWHKPLDPHQYSTAMRGVLALPMLTRGTLLGVLVLGERLGGEAYAPDEVQVLTDVAQAVGSAFGALSANRNGARASFEETVLERLRIILSALKDPSRPDRPT
jgi:GAF domain-containing protein